MGGIHAGCEPVQAGQHLHEVGENPVGEAEAQVAGCGLFEGGTGGAPEQAFGVVRLPPWRSPSLCTITPLPIMLASSGHGFTISDGVIEGLGEIRAHQQGEIRVFRALVRPGMAVDRDDRIQGLDHHFAEGIHAEGPDAVVKGSRIVDEFGFVGLACEVFHDCSRKLHPDTEIHRVRAWLPDRASLPGPTSRKTPPCPELL